MDTVVKSGIFSEPDHDSEAEPKQKKRMVDLAPVVQMVFALASPVPAVVFKTRAEKRHYFDEFATIDIWLAGLSDKTCK
jgi:hypothetical protein